MSERQVSSKSSRLVAGVIALSLLAVEAKFFFHMADSTESYLQDSRATVARPAPLGDCAFVVSVQQPLDRIQDAMERETGIEGISPSGLLDPVGRSLTVADRPGLVEGFAAGALAGDAYLFEAEPADCRAAQKSLRPIAAPNFGLDVVGGTRPDDSVELLVPRPLGTDIPA